MVERCFGKLEQRRAMATRFGKLAGRYLAGAVIASLMLWLRHAELSDTAAGAGRRGSTSSAG
ncbi:hypothetical protein GCM10018953_46330 [Streptosporangium nondiastaticum]